MTACFNSSSTFSPLSAVTACFMVQSVKFHRRTVFAYYISRSLAWHWGDPPLGNPSSSPVLCDWMSYILATQDFLLLLQCSIFDKNTQPGYLSSWVSTHCTSLGTQDEGWSWGCGAGCWVCCFAHWRWRCVVIVLDRGSLKMWHEQLLFQQFAKSFENNSKQFDSLFMFDLFLILRVRFD